MAKIILQTTVPIDYDQWLEQSGRFAGKGENISFNPMPLKLSDSNDNREAHICVEFKSPLYNGFNGTITYIQRYKTTEPYQDRDPETFEPIGEVIEKDVIKEKQMITYSMSMTSAQISALLDQVDPLIPNDISERFQRELTAIGIIAINNAVNFKTFNLNKGQITIKAIELK